MGLSRTWCQSGEFVLECEKGCSLVNLDFYLPSHRRPGMGDIGMPPICPSVCLFVYHVSFLHCNSKMHCCIFSKLSRYLHQVMGVCCIVFDIDGMLFDFCYEF